MYNARLATEENREPLGLVERQENRSRVLETISINPAERAHREIEALRLA